jgi:hypothetical protein
MKTVRFVPLVAALWLLAPGKANADVRLSLGADYWAVPQEGFFTVTLAVDGYIARNLQVGGRFGGLLTTYGNTFGVPLDLLLRADLGHVYLEGLVGPWLFFEPSVLDLRFHGAFGFGLQSGGLLFGIEVGLLDPWPHAGLRLGFRI